MATSDSCVGICSNVLQAMASWPNRLDKQYPSLSPGGKNPHEDSGILEKNSARGISKPDSYSPVRLLLRSVSTPKGAVESLLEGCGIESVREKHVEVKKLTPRADPRIQLSPKPNIVTNICGANRENISVMAKDLCPPYGTMSTVGRRSEMEDTVAVVPSFYCAPSKGSASGSAAFHFFGVYDGHGGSQASAFCRERLHETLAKELQTLSPSPLDNFRRDYANWKMAMTNCYKKIDIAVGGACPRGDCSCNDTRSSNRDYNNKNGEGSSYCTCCRELVAPENVGSTAVVAVVSPSQIVVGNCGDSRAVLCRGGRAIPFSMDHKPDREDEMDRIEAAGGRVIYWNGYRVGGFLAMSRAIGDRFLKQYVISEPEVTCTERTDDDEFLVLASDGLWDVLTNESVCDVVRKCLAGYRPHRFKPNSNLSSVTVAATLLTKLAFARGSTDNISVIVIDLNQERTRRNRFPSSLNIQNNL